MHHLLCLWSPNLLSPLQTLPVMSHLQAPSTSRNSPPLRQMLSAGSSSPLPCSHFQGPHHLGRLSSPELLITSTDFSTLPHCSCRTFITQDDRPQSPHYSNRTSPPSLIICKPSPKPSRYAQTVIHQAPSTRQMAPRPPPSGRPAGTSSPVRGRRTHRAFA